MAPQQNTNCYIFFDTETTGLPHQERNRTKIIELCMVAVLTQDLMNTNSGQMPKIYNKINMLINPEREILPNIIKLTSISNNDLKHAPTFKDSFKNVISFLEGLPKPLCIVAHNGNVFDYKILLSECRDAGVHVPDYVLCIDSLVGFRKLLKGTMICYESLKHAAEISFDNFQVNKVTETKSQLNNESKLEISTNSEESEWPELNISTEEWQEVDERCDSLVEMSFGDMSNSSKNYTPVKQKSIEITKKYKTEAIRNVFNKKSEKKEKCKTSEVEKENFKLSNVYKRLLNKEPESLHRAEADCLLLAECVVALRHLFLPWAEQNKKSLHTIKPFIPY